MTGSYTSALIRENGNGCMYLVTGSRNTKPIWCYVTMPANKVSIFLKALSSPSIDLAKFGNVLFSGTGKTPPDEITHIIHHHFEGRLQAD